MMGTPIEAVSVPTIVRMTRHGQPNQVSDPRMRAFIESGAYDLALDHPDYDGLAEQLRGKAAAEPAIRRAQRLTVEACGPKLDAPFNGAQILTDVYGEGEGSFDLTTVEPFHLNTSLRLRPALEAAMPRRTKISMGARRRRWFVKSANARTLPVHQQALADQWRKEGKAIFFPDSSWESTGGNEYFEYAFDDGERWRGFYRWSGNDVDTLCCILSGK
jgi:hypothetical protein